MGKIAKIAVNGSKIAEVTKPEHVTYSIENYVPKYCAGYDPDTNLCVNWQGGYWTSAGSGSTGAKITGTVSSSSSLKVTGNSAAKIGDTTNETWVASPPIPSSNGSTRYTATSPVSGSGQGSITEGNGKNVKLNGQLIATVGAEVTTCLGNKTIIADGNNLINM
ncbi:hypothetical protein [Paenibacillus odorifer]|uniref:hypothetical protein n=1 Tax=Paenibacillus odorifer TaxID=189426 RepID=UPI00096CEE3A|nr:hypothetical protein [Paenibacillus odorifer]OMD71228.1 hypothetical protein BSK50_26480 [Paenibacillus odorifer]